MSNRSLLKMSFFKTSLLKDFIELPQQQEVTQKSYRRELVTELTVPMSFAVMEGGFVGVVADKLYQVEPWVLAIITAAPMFSNLSSFVWAKIIRGRDKVSTIVTIQYLILLFTGLVALTPSEEWGAWIIVAAVIVVRLLMAGQITARSMVWSLNYGRSSRARITGRLMLVHSFTMVMVVSLGGLSLDANPDSFRYIFCIAAILGVIGVRAFSKITVPGDLAQIELESGSAPDASDNDTTSMWQVLKQDPAFARYQRYQFLAGTSNMMLEAPLIYLVSNQLAASYSVSLGITVIIPFVVSMCALPLWANYLDRHHVTLFRARQSIFWVGSQLIMWLGALNGSFILLALGRLVLGIARGGGSLAWNLGHNDFSSQKLLATYMGAHVTLTGIRGATAPFIGIALYLGWSDVPLLADFDGIGAGVFLIAACLSGLSWRGYNRMRADLERQDEESKN